MRRHLVREWSNRRQPPLRVHAALAVFDALADRLDCEARGEAAGAEDEGWLELGDSIAASVLEEVAMVALECA